MSSATISPTQLAVRFEGISKRFGGTVALDEVSFDVARGSVHALLGGNGSGKSTLVKILTGVYRADAGTISIDGEAHRASKITPDWARAMNIHVVHQGIGTFPDLTVADNFALSHGYGVSALAPIGRRALIARVREILERFEIDVSPTALMSELPPALQTMVAVARALPAEDDSDAVLILDEPTAALPQSQQELLLDAVRGYRRHGHTVMLVTHRLDEVKQVADTVTFLRDGRHLETRSATGIEDRVLVERIAGMAHVQAVHRVRVTNGRVRLKVTGLAVRQLRGVSFHAEVGEIVGLSGLQGSGRSDLMLAVFGSLRPDAGEILLDAKRLKVRDPADAIRQGIAYLSSERQKEGVFLDVSVRENLAMPDLRRYWRALGLSKSGEASAARRVIDTYRVVVRNEEATVSSMSGGNQQKIALARWLELKPRLLLLNEPTQGVDVGARAAIHDLVRAATEADTTVIVASSDSRELAELCDRVIGIYRGEICGEASGPELDAGRCIELAYGRGLIASETQPASPKEGRTTWKPANTRN